MQFYYFVDGERKGPIAAAQLKTLAALGEITTETEIELEDGRRIQARKVQGLTFKVETPEEKTNANEIYGVAQPSASPSETPFPPDEVPVFAPSATRLIPSVEPPTKKRGKFGASVVLFALSAVFLTAAFGSAIVGGAQLKKMKTTLVLAPSAERLDELDDERIKRLKDLAEDSPSTESSLLALNSALWQMRAIHDARHRPSISAESYIDALNRLDFDKHEFVGGDAYNYEVNASLFTGLGVLGVGADVRDVGTVIAAGAGFVCAALFASTSALLLALGLLARRTSAV